MNHIEIYKTSNALVSQRWYWRVRNQNGEIVTDGGEGYYSKWNAKRSAKKLFPQLEIKKDVWR